MYNILLFSEAWKIISGKGCFCSLIFVAMPTRQNSCLAHLSPLPRALCIMRRL